MPRGSARDAGPGDFDLVFAWSSAFHEEATLREPWDPADVERRLRRRLAGDGAGGLRLWVDGTPVSLAGFGGRTPNGVRIGPVYTPPDLRGRGYATALVADVSREMLVQGRRFSFLYTDMSNPTSNAIYRRIGYRLVCGSAMILFA